jgi:hypothetical protein
MQTEIQKGTVAAAPFSFLILFFQAIPQNRAAHEVIQRDWGAPQQAPDRILRVRCPACVVSVLHAPEAYLLFIHIISRALKSITHISSRVIGSPSA